MSDKSHIEWTDASWNPVTGCSHVSEGCRNCYAEALSLRFNRSQHPWTAPYAAEHVVLHPERLSQPLKWKEPRRIFVNSMSDLFHEQVPFDYVARVWDTMWRAPQHTFQILTKRPERMREFATKWYSERSGLSIRQADFYPHVWLGVSVEDQRAADERIPLLLATPAAVRFLSCEPLLGPVEFSDVTRRSDAVEQLGKQALNGIHWVIAGGESGPKHRTCELDWLRGLRDQCRVVGVPFFLKQLGGLRPGGDAVLDGQTWRQFPEPARG
jgi:protein gp37